jgi:hypothetical protein
VGVGVGGVNLEPGDCLVAHATNIAFAYTGGTWRRIGVAPQTGVLRAAIDAARHPNARVDLATGTVAFVRGRGG